MIRGSDMSLAQGFEFELKLLYFLVGTEDFDEGIQAFVERGAWATNIVLVEVKKA